MRKARIFHKSLLRSFPCSVSFLILLLLAVPTAGASSKCDLSAAVTAKTLVQKLNRGEGLIFVDVRPAEYFEKLRIPGSINLPLHAIKTKAYLKQTPIVLVDAGFAYNRLSAICKSLNRKGFNASVLYGGLLAWNHFGGRLDGDMHLLAEHHRIAFEEFYAEKDYGNQLVVYVGEEPSDDSELPAGIHLSMGPNPRKWALQLRPYLQKAATYPYVNVVLIAGDDRDKDRILSLAASANVQHWFFLEGGITGYLNKLINIALTAKPKDQRIKMIGTCSQCRQEMGSNLD